MRTKGLLTFDFQTFDTPQLVGFRAAGRFGSFENMRTKGLLTFDFQTFDTRQLVRMALT